MQKLREKIAKLIDTEKEVILDEFCSKLIVCFWPRQNSQPMPEWLIAIIRARFSDVLNRQVSYLRTGKYINSASLEDTTYAVQIIPFCSQDLKSSRLIRTLELFTDTVKEHIFNRGVRSTLPYASIAPFLDKLIYLSYEDLWITTIVSHRFQKNIIQKLLKKTMKAYENERQELAIVLHDGVLQSLATALVRTQIVEKLIKPNQRKKLTQELLRLQEVITETIRKIRDLNYDLYPPSLREQGLIAALHSYVAGFQRETGVFVDIVAPEALDKNKWYKDTQVSIYRMIHELMTNVKKHANANHVRIEISTEDERIHLAIEDDGIGFDLPQTLANLPSSAAFGLLSVSEQTRGFDGLFRIQTAFGQGTRIEIEIPSDDKKV